MKTLLFSLSLLSTSALAATTLRLPVLDEKGQLLAQLNSKLAAKKSPVRFPTFVEMSGPADRKKLKTIESDLDEANRVLGLQGKKALSFNQGSVPDEWSVRSFHVCYQGDPHGVADTVAALADVAFSDQLSISAWRYKTEVHADKDTLDELKSNGSLPEVWEQWRGQGEAVLLLTSYGDGGDDLESNLIYRCATTTGPRRQR